MGIAPTISSAMAQFNNIAVASTFSNRFLPMLAEAARISQMFGDGFSVIHAGEQSEESQSRFDEAFLELSLSPSPIVHWTTGEPVEAIVRAINEQSIDLLIAGALEKETPGHNYTGKVARSLMHEARCSLLFFTEPSIHPKPFRQIVAITDFSELSMMSLKHASFLAAKDSAERIHLVRIFTIFAQAREQPEEFFGNQDDRRKAMLEVEEKRLADFAAASGAHTVQIETICVEGTTGIAASEYVETVKADLLVVPSQLLGSPQLFPDGMDWIVSVIPSNLLILRKKCPTGIERGFLIG